MLVLSLIHINNVKAAVYKVLQTFSQRITWVFCSTMVYATKGAPSECQQHWPKYGGRDLQSYSFTDSDTTNVLVPRKGYSYQTDREPLPH